VKVSTAGVCGTYPHRRGVTPPDVSTAAHETEGSMPEPIPVPPFLRRLPAEIVERIRATAARPSGRDR